jgi:class 3 adenylate cyclase
VRFNRILQEVVWCLLTEGRISYYRIRHDFGLDREGLDELRSVLVEAKGWATDQDGQFLVSALQVRPLPSPPRPGSNLPALRADDDHRAQAGGLEAGAPPQPAPPAAPALAADLPGAERRQLTVMFCDLVGSTDLSTRLDPEDLADAIRAYRDAASALIRRFDGFVAKYMGDGILVYFGYPHAQEKDAERAVRTGLAILEAMPALNAEVGAAAGAELAVRVGVATGLVMVGEAVGTGSAAEKVVIGETPNLAARLQGLAPPNGVVVSTLTRELAGEAFAYEDLGAHALKGIAEPVRAWSVTGLRQGEVGTGRPAPPLVGRDEELGLLRRAWHQARDEGRGQVVTVSGEPGIGKSALVQALRADAQVADLPRMTFRCSPYHTNSASTPWSSTSGTWRAGSPRTTPRPGSTSSSGCSPATASR